jgi:hypothetical protein
MSMERPSTSLLRGMERGTKKNHDQQIFVRCYQRKHQEQQSSRKQGQIEYFQGQHEAVQGHKGDQNSPKSTPGITLPDSFNHFSS